MPVDFSRLFTANYDTYSYQDIKWETRSSNISGVDGKSVFTMEDVIVPSFWSPVATDIIAQKYFRKAGIDFANLKKCDEPFVPEWLQRSYVSKEDRKEPLLRDYENSAEQIFHRLAGTWTYWAWKAGYFFDEYRNINEITSISDSEFSKSEERAKIFYDECCYMLVHQMAAPNSPQFFNTGLHWAYGIDKPTQGHYYVDPLTKKLVLSENEYEHPQASACFILSIEDNLLDEGGIMDLWMREARLFKHGSGAGSNFSNIRGLGEPLSGGGKSSGLMSFLKIGDTTAGSIKSGGTSRRAAKMVILNDDHPDIEEFIDWKVKEEQKVAAMVTGSKICKKHLSAIYNSVNNDKTLKQEIAKARKAFVPENYIQRVISLANMNVPFDFKEFDVDWQSEAYATVSGQNANNTVSLSKEFMNALEKNEKWNLTYRTDGSIAKTINAKDLWSKIALAAWQSADPGVHFSSTINEWHTCPKSGRINSSNPCCFTGETYINTENGDVEISQLVTTYDNGEPLPKTVSYNSENKQVELKQIKRAWKSGETTELVEITTKYGHVLRCTYDHIWFLRNDREVIAKDLKIGHYLFNFKKDNTRPNIEENDRIVKISYISLEKPIPVYDLEVEDNHNFCVKKKGIDGSLLVHNSEYLFLDNTACNLASINLLKFYDNKKFDMKAFHHACRIWTTVLEISVVMGQFPSKEIAENSYRYRTLGLGFANIGGLLMSAGIPYDSEAGRQLASVITSFMTGSAYYQSALMALYFGAFEGYKDNKEDMLRVIHNHYVATNTNSQIEFKDLTVKPKRINWGVLSDLNMMAHYTSLDILWQQTIELGEKHGFRNAQSTVLAPTGCTLSETKIVTNDGIKSYRDIMDENGIDWKTIEQTDEPRWFDLKEFELPSLHGVSDYSDKIWYNGHKQTYKITFEDGKEYEFTANHQLPVKMQDGTIIWTRVDELKGDEDILNY